MIKPKNFGLIAGLIASCGAAVYSFGIYNYSLNTPFWSFAPWQILGIILLFATGALIAYSSYKDNFKRAIFFINAYVILISIVTIVWGTEVIQKQELIFRLVYFRGQEAVSYGKMAIGFGVFGLISTLLMKIKKAPNATSAFLICSNCLEPHAAHTVTALQCPKCGAHLENLGGFYDRHPELRNREKGENNSQLKGYSGETTKEIIRVHHEKSGLSDLVKVKVDNSAIFYIASMLLTLVALPIALGLSAYVLPKSAGRETYLFLIVLPIIGCWFGYKGYMSQSQQKKTGLVLSIVVNAFYAIFLTYGILRIGE